jgi:CSLREA domain-containing protein
MAMMNLAIITRALGRTACLSLMLAAAVPAYATTIPVSTNADTVAEDGTCSLREALTAANTDTASGVAAGECPAGSGSDVVTIPAMSILLTHSLEVTSPMEVVGSGVTGTVVDGQRRGRVFVIRSAPATLRGLTVSGGAGSGGAGVYVDTGATVEISDARISGNVTVGGIGGGGLYVAPNATVTLRRSTIDGNQSLDGGVGGGALNQGTLRVYDSLVGGDLPANGRGNDATSGGGIFNASGSSLLLVNTTISGNTAQSDAGTGGIHNNGFAFLGNVTITLNTGRGRANDGSSGGGGLQTILEATTVLENSIVAGNNGINGPNDCVGPLSTDSAYDLIGDPAGCGLPPIEQPPQPATFILDQPALLGELAFNGGPTRTHLPAAGSPAVDAGAPYPPGGPADDSCQAHDQRGVPRLYCDIGAAEREVAVPDTLTVNVGGDAADAKPGDGKCATPENACTLRAAVQESNLLPGMQTIVLPAMLRVVLSVPTGQEEGPGSDATGDLDLFDNVIIAGADRASSVVSGNHLARVFDVAPNVKATMRQMTIRDGQDVDGGGVRLSSAGVTMDDVIVEDNAARDGGGIGLRGLDLLLDIRNSILRNNRASGGNGGAISGDGTITINRTSILGNEASGGGGGLFASGAVKVVDSTIAGNKATGAGALSSGGGISVVGLDLQSSTVSGNVSEGLGGGVSAYGTIVNSTISGNTAAIEGGGVSTSGTLAILHTTIAANHAQSGGNGLVRFGSTSELSVQNTILANPGGTECSGLAPASKGGNIASDRSCALAGGGGRQALDALIDPLADNGGPTRTHRPRDGSPAIDGAINRGLALDQRGVARPQGPRPDVGSVERRQ